MKTKKSLLKKTIKTVEKEAFQSTENAQYIIQLIVQGCFITIII